MHMRMRTTTQHCDLSSVMLFRLFKTQHSMGGVGEECLSRDGGSGDVGVLHLDKYH